MGANVGLAAMRGDGGETVSQSGSTLPDAGTGWLRKTLQAYGAYGKVTVPGGSQPIVTAVRNLRFGGNAFFGALDVHQCVRSGLD